MLLIKVVKTEFISVKSEKLKFGYKTIDFVVIRSNFGLCIYIFFSDG